MPQRWPRSDVEIEFFEQRPVDRLWPSPRLRTTMSPLAMADGNPMAGAAISRGGSTRTIRSSFLRRSSAWACFLAVVVAADELLGLGDFLLLLLVGPPLDQQSLGLLPPVGGEVAACSSSTVPRNKLERAVGDPVEEVAVVADHDHRRTACGEEVLEPLGGLDIEMVRRLVQKHQFRLGQEQLQQHEPVLLAAAERLDRLAVAVSRRSRGRAARCSILWSRL